MYLYSFKFIIFSLILNIFPLAAAEATDASPPVGSGTKVHFEDGSFVRSPIRRGARTYREIIFINCESIGEIDPLCFQEDPNLSTVNFTRSGVNLTSLTGGLFGRACPKLTTVVLVNSGISLKEFVENLAAPELLALIMAGTCSLRINRADGDDASGDVEEVEGTPIYSQPEIITMIRAFSTPPATTGSSRVAEATWWLIGALRSAVSSSGADEAAGSGGGEAED